MLGELLEGKLHEQFLWGGTGNGLRLTQIPRQPLTREVFHKILKSGCRAEQVRLRTAPRLMNLLTVFCLLNWRVFWLTMTNRIAPEADPNGVFTNLELRILDRLINDKPAVHRRLPQLSDYLIKLARLGGYLARNGDPPPGNETIWKGLVRLIDIQTGRYHGC